MSWGASAGNGVSSGNIYGDMANIGGNGAEMLQSGFGVMPDKITQLSGLEASNLGRFGATDPSALQQVEGLAQEGADYYGRFNRGMGSDFKDAVSKDNLGNNPETYGYATGKVLSAAALTGRGSAAAAQPAPMQPAYQQPENEYFRKYGRR